MRRMVAFNLMLMLSLTALNQISLPQTHYDVDSVIVDSLYKGVLYDSHQVTGYIDGQVVFQQQWDDVFSIRSLEVNTKDVRLFILWSGDGLSIRSLTTNTLNDPLGVTLSLNAWYGIEYSDIYLDENSFTRERRYPNGALRATENWKKDEELGYIITEKRKYYESGELESITRFENGNLKLSQSYFQTGMLQWQCIYSGEYPPRIINSMLFDEEGNLIN